MLYYRSIVFGSRRFSKEDNALVLAHLAPFICGNLSVIATQVLAKHTYRCEWSLSCLRTANVYQLHANKPIINRLHSQLELSR